MNSIFTIYDVSSGEILRTVSCPEQEVSNFALEGEGIANGAFEGGYFHLGAFLSFPTKPSPHHDWDWTTKTWLPNLDAARESQRLAWNAWRDRELIAGYAHNGHVFHSDDRFMAELQLILKGYEKGYLTGTSAIRTRDNGTLQMTHAEIESLLLLIGLHRQEVYAESWAGKDALAGLTTLEDIVAGGPPA